MRIRRGGEQERYKENLGKTKWRGGKETYQVTETEEGRQVEVCESEMELGQFESRTILVYLIDLV